MLVSNHPGFLCPLCRTFADLEDAVEIDDPIEEVKPVQNAALSVENETTGEIHAEHVIEAAQATPVQIEATSGSMEVASTSTPVQDTLMQLETVSSTTNNIDLETNQSDSAPTPPSSVSPSPSQHIITSATVSPMNIVGSISVTSVEPIAQQSPSSAFLSAPSPPMFVSNFGVSPIPFAVTISNSTSRHSSSSQNHQPSSSSPTSHVGHMLQSFVRNISHRNRSRTNSNPATPFAVPNTNASGQAQSSSSEVYSKTLSMSPPSISRTGTTSELGVVSEMEVSQLLGEEGNTSSGSSSGGNSRSSSGGNSRSSSQSRGSHHHLEDNAGATLHNSHTITAEAN
ncbi:hypothetical protein BGZ76_002533 [Entomortierella beljakovae]|nr:hypothetical protein BGZ76_002533 [Entomortierella beljakovae]